MEGHIGTKLFTTVAVMAAAACTGGQSPQGSSRSAEAGTTAEWEPETAAVLFTATADGRREVFLIEGPDRGPRLLSVEPGPQNFGRWSPDGSRVAYQSWADGASEIFVTAVDPWDPVNLTRHADHDVLPIWSPDGDRIAFMSTRGFELGGERGPFPGHLYSARFDGSDLRQLTRDPLTSSLGPQDWSPDGARLLLSREADGSLELFELDLTSGVETRLTRTSVAEYGAAYSPDGTQIAFHGEADGASQIEVMDRDGTARRALTSGPGLRYGPRWSPDGAWLVYAVEGSAPEDYDVRAIHVADGRDLAVVATPRDEREASWRPW